MMRPPPNGASCLRQLDGRAAVSDTDLSLTQKWAVTLSVMPLTVMQILDSSVTNVTLPHMQGSLSAGVEEISWVVTSFLAAHAIVIPATGWLTARLGRRRLFLLCTALFTLSSFLSSIVPNLEFLVAMRILQGVGGGPIIPISQAILWEIFPLAQRGMAMAVWGFGIVLAPTFGPTVGGGSPTTGPGAGSSTSTWFSPCCRSCTASARTPRDGRPRPPPRPSRGPRPPTSDSWPAATDWLPRVTTGRIVGGVPQRIPVVLLLLVVVLLGP